MARGKEAVQASARRLEAAYAHIDRLTEELVDAKLRARDAEARARRLEGIEALLPTAVAKNDAMLQQALTALRTWRRWGDELHEQRGKALHEMGTKLIPDLDLIGGGGPVTTDVLEFLKKRYPAIVLVMTGSSWEGESLVTFESPSRPLEEKLGPEELRRFQRLMGERLVFQSDQEADASKVWADMLDAKVVGLSTEETMEYVFGPGGHAPDKA
jgi:hypothetical protein